MSRFTGKRQKDEIGIICDIEFKISGFGIWNINTLKCIFRVLWPGIFVFWNRGLF